jgi:hypothetical protein
MTLALASWIDWRLHLSNFLLKCLVLGYLYFLRRMCVYCLRSMFDVAIHILTKKGKYILRST